jgi:hypothetical protein
MLETQKQRRQKTKAPADNPTQSDTPTQSQEEIRRDLQRSKTFESFLRFNEAKNPAHAALAQITGATNNFVSISFPNSGAYIIKRTEAGYKLTAICVIDKEHHVTVASYEFEPSGKFIRQTEINARGQVSVSNDVNKASEADQLLRKLSAHKNRITGEMPDLADDCVMIDGKDRANGRSVIICAPEGKIRYVLEFD